MADVAPSQTVYVSNLVEKVKKEELKRCLHAAFSQFGRILDVVVVRHARTRGQAWVVFSDQASAADAVRSLQGFPLLDAAKPMRLTYALGKSDAAAKADGTFKAAQVAARAAARKGKRAGSGRGGVEAAGGAKRAAAAATGAAAAAPAAGGEGPPSEAAAAPPNSTLFVTNLPETTTDSMLSMLFQQFPGFSRTRMVPAKPGIAFVEFETEVAAGVAKSGLHGFKITPEKAMNVEYAKR